MNPGDHVTCTYVNKGSGAILVTKTPKNLNLGTGQHPLAGATFTVIGVSKVTDASGQACFDGLALGTAYTVTEIAAPTGYSIDTTSQSVTPTSSASCTSGTPDSAITAILHCRVGQFRTNGGRELVNATRPHTGPPAFATSSSVPATAQSSTMSAIPSRRAGAGAHRGELLRAGREHPHRDLVAGVDQRRVSADGVVTKSMLDGALELREVGRPVVRPSRSNPTASATAARAGAASPDRLHLSIRSRIDMSVANVRTPRGAWVDAALQALAAGGPDAVRVEALAVSLGVSKGGFYWHFTDRQALLEEMLDTWEKAGTEDVITRVESQPADPRAKLQQLFELAPSADFAVELALRDWSRRDSDVAGRLHRIDNRRMGWLRSLFRQFCVDENDVEARSMLAYSLLIGSYFIAAQHDDTTRSQMLQLAVDRLLSESWD